MTGEKPVSHLIVCVCGNDEYAVRDVIDASMFRGGLDTSWQEFLARAEAEQRADELDVDLDAGAICAAVEAFRYERDLITAEETETWLRDRGLTLDDFSDYFTRQYYATAVRETVIPDDVEYASAPPELRRVFVTDLILSGELGQMTDELMWRLAARCVEKEVPPKSITAEECSFFERNRIEPPQLAGWLERLGRDPNWFNEMLALEVAYRKRCATLLVPQARQRELVGLRLPLTRVKAELIELESRDAAREALFCVREDGMSMEEVAVEGKYPYRRADFFLEDVPADVQQRFLSVSAGDVLEPIAREDGFELCRVVKRIEPQADDPTVKARIDQRLLHRHFSELTSKYTRRRLDVSVPAE